MKILDIQMDDVLTLKKKHPCGGFDWKVVRLGADIGIVCTTCDHKVILPRAKLEARVKKLSRER